MRYFNYTVIRLNASSAKDLGFAAETMHASSIIARIKTDLFLSENLLVEKSDDPRIVLLQETRNPHGHIAAIFQPKSGQTPLPLIMVRAPRDLEQPFTNLDDLLSQIMSEYPMLIMPWEWSSMVYWSAQHVFFSANLYPVSTDSARLKERADVLNMLRHQIEKMETKLKFMDKESSNG